MAGISFHEEIDSQLNSPIVVSELHILTLKCMTSFWLKVNLIDYAVILNGSIDLEGDFDVLIN